MADDKRDPPAPDSAPNSVSGRRRRRAAPTIDLKATDVTRETVASDSSEPSSDAFAPGGEMPATSPAPDAASTAGAQDAAGPGPDGDLRASQRTDAGSDQSAGPGREPASEFKPDSPRDFAPDGGGGFSLRDTFTTGALAAGLVGGLLVALVLFGLWLSGMVPIRYAGTTAMRARVAGLEMQVRDLGKDLASRPAANAGQSGDLAARLDKLEAAIAERRPAATDPALLQRLDAAETALKSAGVALTALNGRVDTVMSRLAVAEQSATESSQRAVSAAADSALAARIDALEKAASAADASLAKSRADSDAAEKLALRAGAVSALRDAVLSGEPFARSLAAVASAGGNAAAIAALRPFADSGVPNEAALARELSALVPALLKSASPDTPRDGGFLERLQANAAKLVRVRPAGEAAGGDPAAVVARIEAKAARADIAGALSELQLLTAAHRAPAETWIARVEARRAALEASRALAAETFRPSGQP